MQTRLRDGSVNGMNATISFPLRITLTSRGEGQIRSVSRTAAVVLAMTLLGAGLGPVQGRIAGGAEPAEAGGPYILQAEEKLAHLGSEDAGVRARAAEALGYLRYYPAESALLSRLGDADAAVRRNAVLSLGWCGGRDSLLPLTGRLQDSDWTVRQAAWVSLTNLTGMEFPYDALAERAVRNDQARRWRQWCQELPEAGLPVEVRELLSSESHYEVERGLRAAGFLGGEEAVPPMVAAIEAWTSIANEGDQAARRRVQAGIRALGRSRQPSALPALVEFLNHRQWSRYAADALGDLGGEAAAAPLLDAFPRYAQGFERPGQAPETHPDDRPHLDPSDRVLATPYAMALSLSRIGIRDADNLSHLRRQALLLAAQIPLDIDGLMTYDEEPFQKLVRHLLDQAGLRQVILDATFERLGAPRPEAEMLQRLAEMPGLQGLASTGEAAESPAAEDWHAAMRQAVREHYEQHEVQPLVRTPVLRGRDAPLQVQVDVSGWQDLYLIVEDVEDYYQDRANWADAKLMDADGQVTWLDELEPVSAEQQHDTLRLNQSASFDDLRIGDRRFERGLHTHAISVIHFRIGGDYERFESWVGVCASRSPGRGSVQFVVTPEPVDDAQGLEALWAEIKQDFPDSDSRQQIAWERSDQAVLWGPGVEDTAAMTSRYADRLSGPLAEEGRQAVAALEGEAALSAARAWYYRDQLEQDLAALLDRRLYAVNLMTALCRDAEDVPRLIALLDHENHWIRINAAKTLVFQGAEEAVEAIGERLRNAPPEGDFGFFNEPYFARAQGWDEFSDPAPRFREAYVMALGQLGAVEYVPLLIDVLFDDRNVLEVQYRAANALDLLGTPQAVEALREAELSHPYHSVRMVAREALWRRGAAQLPRTESRPAAPQVDESQIPDRPTRFVFIKGDPIPYNPFQMDSWRQAYMTTDSGPTYRPGRNLYLLDIAGGEPEVTPLTRFEDGYVADCTVSYDGQSVLFSRRLEDSPWWHIYRIRADGSGLEQVTQGPYHDVHPHEMPNGRIVFSTSRLGARDEYHGYLCTGLATMNPDGSDIQVIGFNLGRDAEPVVATDGRLLFTRLELFYSRMKTEWNLLAAFPDGTRMHTLYGPERRSLWAGIHGGYTSWGMSGPRHRQLRLTQPQPYLPGRYVLNTPAGPVITQGRFAEQAVRQDFLRSGGNDPWAITTPYPLDENTLLVAAGEKPQEIVRGDFPSQAVDLGLYLLDIPSGQLTRLYNDPTTVNFEARPLHPRRVPPQLMESPASREGGFTGTLYANSVFLTQVDKVRERGRLIRVIEGLPQVARHMTHTSGGGEAWKNHGGAFARVLATLPLAADGSFAAEVPADRLLHLQVLDSDRQVVGNQTVWMHLRPGENKGCVGCHEPPHSAAMLQADFPLSLSQYGNARQESPKTPPVAFPNLRLFAEGELPQAVPDGHDQFRYRAKVWFKGHLPHEREQRQRTVQAINLFGRP